MTHAARLGGFKILKNVVRFSLNPSTDMECFPAGFCRVLAGKKINLPYFTTIKNNRRWGIQILVEAVDGEKTLKTIKESFKEIDEHHFKSIILSVFPHRKNPEITGHLFETFNRQGVAPDALTNSPSAISVVLKNEFLGRASDALFEPFSFSAYRTPADWKLAQKGKEQLYKEVVASYQEKRPKVYGLEYYEGQGLFRIQWDHSQIGHFGEIFKTFSQLGLDLTFLATGPSMEKGKHVLAFCLPGHSEMPYHMISVENTEHTAPVSVFSMTGPHFGDRYGIASELLTAIENNDLDLICLSCTIASITGVVPSHQTKAAIKTITECFDVPSVTKKE